MKTIELEIGKKYNQLTVLSKYGRKNPLDRCTLWLCRCDCGVERLVRGSAVFSGGTKSCGCLLKTSEKRKSASIRNGKANATHGTSKNPETKSTWSSWGMMRQRCLNPKRNDYKNYGGRGIVPCGFVLESPLNVIQLIGLRPEGTSIDRINNNSGYTCGGCDECKKNGWPLNLKWSTRTEQVANRRNTVHVTIDGIKKTLSQWKAEKGIAFLRQHYASCEHKI